MKIDKKHFKTSEVKSLMVSTTKKLDILSGISTIENENVSYLLTKANTNLKQLRATYKDVLKLKGKKEKEYFLLNEVDNMELNSLDEILITKALIRDVKQFDFEYLQVKELLFKPIFENDVIQSLEVGLKEYDIILGIDTEKHHDITYLMNLEFDSKKNFVTINEIDLKNAVSKDRDGSKLEKVKSLFEMQNDLLDTNNINIVSGDLKRMLENSKNEIEVRVLAKIKGYDIFCK
ncbi:MAG: hypothetical protein ACRCYT_04920 [Cetobacterium sp.]